MTITRLERAGSHVKQHFGAVLRQMREDAGASQRDLERTMRQDLGYGVTAAEISRIENSERNPTLITADALAYALGCTVQDMVDACVARAIDDARQP